MVIFTTTMMKILYYVFAFQLYSQEFYAKTKQNKTRQNKKKYTLLLELLQSGFEDYATTSIHSCDNLSGHQWQQP
jgi:hypothetical protein